MTDAFVHVVVEPGAVTQAAQAIAESDTVEQVHLVTGEHDLVVQIAAPKDDIATIVTQDVHSVTGVLDTVTHVAFEP